MPGPLLDCSLPWKTQAFFVRRFVVRLRVVRFAALLAGAFFAALRRRLAGAFLLAGAFFAALRRFLAGAFLAALRLVVALRLVALRLAGAFFAALRLVVLFFAGAFFAAFRFAVDLRFAGAFLLAALRLAGAFLAAFLFVAFFAGGTVTTFLRELSLGKFELRGYSVREGEQPHALRDYELLTSFLNSVPTLNFTLFEAAI